MWAAEQGLFTVSDSNRDPLKDKRGCVSQPVQLASGGSAVLFNDPHRGQCGGNMRRYIQDTWLSLKPRVRELVY